MVPTKGRRNNHPICMVPTKEWEVGESLLAWSLLRRERGENNSACMAPTKEKEGRNHSTCVVLQRRGRENHSISTSMAPFDFPVENRNKNEIRAIL